MTDIKDLKSSLSDELEKSFRHGVISSMPKHPMALVYQGEEAFRVKAFIDTILKQVWGDRYNSIVQYILDGDSFVDTETGANLTVSEVQDSLEKVYGEENSFRDMGQFSVVMILSTSNCENVETFKKNYQKIETFKSILDDGILSTSIILLDESLKNRETATGIRSYLGELIESNSSPYLSTILLSNRLSNGSLLTGSRIAENYSLVCWILILINSVGNGYNPDVFYQIGQNKVITVAFSEVTRPNDAICNIVLHTMLRWIDKHLQKHGNVSSGQMDIEDLYERLEITDGHAHFLEDFFASNLLDKYPSMRDLRFLPYAKANMVGQTSCSFDTFNSMTMGGCYSLISQVNPFDQQLKILFTKSIQQIIQEKLSTAEREKVLSASNVQSLLLKIRPESVTGNEPVDVYVSGKAYEDFVKWATPILEEQLSKEQKNASDHAQEFETIIQEFLQGYFPDDEGLERYYTNITNEILDGLSGGLGARLMADIGSHSTDKGAIIEVLRRSAEEIFSARKVFHMPLEQEMINRMGQNPHDIHNQISNALFRDLDGRIRLRSTIPPSAQKDITIVNKHDENGADTELYRSIKENVSDLTMTYFDSCNSNSIKILRLYTCDSVNVKV